MSYFILYFMQNIDGEQRILHEHLHGGECMYKQNFSCEVFLCLTKNLQHSHRQVQCPPTRLRTRLPALLHNQFRSVRHET